MRCADSSELQPAIHKCVAILDLVNNHRGLTLSWTDAELGAGATKIKAVCSRIQVPFLVEEVACLQINSGKRCDVSGVLETQSWGKGE